ncbi:hypothetical protein SORBI_3005G225901 [Sorghum bicolor]|uniref:Uncharacterized protein n=1 Tax=Sorghum bicolor TaxID=4558 RepID=A0A1Z5RK84_SORBI|nr:hypothetical protein SORBI_3005G225901 [Sorghum bicolor]
MEMVVVVKNMHRIEGLGLARLTAPPGGSPVKGRPPATPPTSRSIRNSLLRGQVHCLGLTQDYKGRGYITFQS